MQGKLDLVNLDAIARALHLGEVTLVSVVCYTQALPILVFVAFGTPNEMRQNNAPATPILRFAISGMKTVS